MEALYHASNRSGSEAVRLGPSKRFPLCPRKRTYQPSIRTKLFYNEALFQLHEADPGLRRQAAVAKCKAMGRPDPYQERAREMAREAGLDPDGRIERLGQRSMPVWCTFRDAASKEHWARAAADAANTTAAEKPQARQFQNSPLKVFGEHDHATVAQMRNCMSVGNVVAGVVCADGHLGYAQPVGG